MDVSVHTDLVYATVDGFDLALDLYLPNTESRPPLVAYFHGGAWKEGDKSADAQTRLVGVARHGVAVASVNYRLIDRAIYPAQVHDAKAAIRWLRANGERLGYSSDRIGAWGVSAGALLSGLLALGDEADLEGDLGEHRDLSSRVDAVVQWFGNIDLVTSARRSWLEDILLAPSVEPPLFGASDVADVVEMAGGASLLHRVRATAPPFLIAHGDRDRIIPETDSRIFFDLLSRAGVDATYVVVGRAGHEGHEFDNAGSLALTAGWLRAQLMAATPTTP